MEEKYIGRICPYCKTEIRETDAVTVCDSCGTAMHEDCRTVTGKCVAIGCTAMRSTPNEQPQSDDTRQKTEMPMGAEPTASEQAAPDPSATEPFRDPAAIYRNPSFCPACGTPTVADDPQCRNCGLIFASYSEAALSQVGTTAVKKKKIAPKAVLAMLICLVLLVGGVAGGIGIHRMNIRKANDELSSYITEGTWYSPEISAAAYSGSLFAGDCSIRFDEISMHIDTESLFFGISEVARLQYRILTPKKIELTYEDGATVCYSVSCFVDADDSTRQMLWEDEDGNCICFSEITDAYSDSDFDGMENFFRNFIG